VTLLIFLYVVSGSTLDPEICAKGPYKYLALEGGGVRGVTYSGAVRALQDAGILQGMEGFSGTSAGSIGAALLAAGYEAEEVADELRLVDFKSFLDSSGNVFVDVSRLMANFGWYSGTPLLDLVEGMLFRKTGVANVTFGKLYELSKKELRITAVNMNTGVLTFFDRRSATDMPVAKAVLASSAIPFFFRPVSYNGDLFVDGGVARSLPLDAFAGDNGTILGLSLMRHGRYSRIVRRESFDSLPEYAMQLLMIFASSATRSVDDYDHTDENTDMASFNVSAVHPVSFDLCESHKDFMVSVGYNDLADLLVKCGHATEAMLQRPSRYEQLPPCNEEGRDFSVPSGVEDEMGRIEDGDTQERSIFERSSANQGSSSTTWWLWLLKGDAIKFILERKKACAITLVTIIISYFSIRYHFADTCCWRTKNNPPKIEMDNKSIKIILQNIPALSDYACSELHSRLSAELYARLKTSVTKDRKEKWK